MGAGGRVGECSNWFLTGWVLVWVLSCDWVGAVGIFFVLIVWVCVCLRGFRVTG